MTNINAADWRGIGNTLPSVYESEFARVSSPLLPYATEIYEACRPHTALALAQMWIENKHATTGIHITLDMHNPLGLRPRGYPEEIGTVETPKGNFAKFATWVDCANAWKRRHTDASIRVNGPVPNYIAATTLEEYITVYAPPEENDTDAYIASVRDYLTLIEQLEGNNMPNIIDKTFPLQYWIPNRGGAVPRIIVLHIQDGTNSGSYDWWLNGYVNGVKVKASSTVMIARNGDIWQVVPEQHGPWTNGDVRSPTAKGQQLINQYGPDPNAYTLSIETEGYSYVNNPFGWAVWPLPQAQLDSVVWQVKQWMAKYNIPKERVIRHADINTVSRRYCPGDDFYAYVIRQLDTTIPPPPPPPTYVKPVPVEGFDGTKNVTIGNATFIADKRTVSANRNGAKVFQYATTSAKETRSPLWSGAKFTVYGWVKGTDVEGDDRWWITESYSRVPVAYTTEKPAPYIDETVNPVIHEGKRFYRADRTVKLIIPANERSDATDDSGVVKYHPAGDPFLAKYWVIGKELLGESIWWAASLNGPYVWAGSTEQKPG